MELTEAEQRILDAAASEVMRCERQLRRHADQANDLHIKVVEAGGRLRGAVTTILTLRGDDPTQYAGTWSPEQECFVITPKAEGVT